MRYIPNLSFWRYLFLTELPFLTIHKANIPSKFMCMTGLFPCPFKKKKYTIIRLTEMSQIFGTENFLEDANTISVFFRNKFRDFDYLFTYFVPQISHELCNQSYRVLQIKNSNAKVLRLLCMN